MDHSQTTGGDTAKLLGGYIPRVLAPLTMSVFFISVDISKANILTKFGGTTPQD